MDADTVRQMLRDRITALGAEITEGDDGDFVCRLKGRSVKLVGAGIRNLIQRAAQKNDKAVMQLMDMVIHQAFDDDGSSGNGPVPTVMT